MSEPLLRVRELSVDFGAVAAVRSVDLDVDRGGCVALVGESGSGKSVTARALLGLAGARARVRARELTLESEDLLRAGAGRWRRIRGRSIGLVLQDALTSLDPLRRIGYEVAEPLEIHRLATADDLDDAVFGLLRRAGIADPERRWRQYPHELSGGLRQRALIASALAGGPRLLIADEPTTALDVVVQQQILDLLRKLRAAGTAVLLISHDLAVVAETADTVAVMYAGVVVEQGPAAAVFGAPAHPYTAELIAAAPRLDGPVAASAAPRWAAPAATGCPFAPRCPLADDDCRTRLPDAIALPGARTVRCLHPGSVTVPIAPVTVPPEPVTTPDSVPLLEFRDASRHYRLSGGGRNVALEPVSFTLRSGDSLGIVGESGSGKSTLARLALAHLTPDSGEVLFDGAPWSRLRERERRPHRHRVQLIDQDPLSSFDPRYSVASIIAEALPRGGSRAERARRVDELLDDVGLSHGVRDIRPARLSGGQRQRVAVARALAAAPDLIVADEPVSALDITIQAQILELFDRVRRERAAALLFISHDLAVVRRLCRRVAVIRHGRIVEIGDTAAVFADPQHEYTRELLAAVPRPPSAIGPEPIDPLSQHSLSKGIA
ncbi:dipeptide ABC transporter ATP-binding protein [Nocardia aurantiaca]|uniref:Dipeptide ABC transporter ATP-binding protein n=1 Tax=Nocardia aurantiaca TaxID=2675850 RepID=A0A6I3KYD3_9NOCA|nr:ABC transporter ATP-binding protein [Nocardia aurantiaca]MTE13566.1 dipeptide ABC transporter ATP-binding protein [Nocardia aurantiaca]